MNEKMVNENQKEGNEKEERTDRKRKKYGINRKGKIKYENDKQNAYERKYREMWKGEEGGKQNIRKGGMKKVKEEIKLEKGGIEVEKKRHRKENKGRGGKRKEQGGTR